VSTTGHWQPITSFRSHYAFLSNFYPCRVLLDGVAYGSVEHAFQAAKTLDRGERERIRQLTSPGDAKRAGRRLTLRPDWDQVKLHVMRELVRQKFMEPALRNKLLQTHPRPLVEENNWGDRFWGVCGGVGENYLGRILMEVRASCVQMSDSSY